MNYPWMHLPLRTAIDLRFTRWMQRCSNRNGQGDEYGAIGGIEGLAFGVLIFAFGTLMVVNAWAVVDGKMAASAAAREAARTYVEASNQAEASRRATAAASALVQERADPHLEISFSSPSGNHAFDRCDAITATARIAIPRVSLPFIGGTGGSFPVSASHTEVIDPYRSGLSSTATC